MQSLAFITALLLLIGATSASKDDLVYGYECREGLCIKVELNEANFQTAISLPVCRLFCGGNNTIGTLWPKPTGAVYVDHLMTHIDYAQISFKFPSASKKRAQLWNVNQERFMKMLEQQIPNTQVVKKGGYILSIEVVEGTARDQNLPKLTLDTDESYNVSIAMDQGQVNAKIMANSFFGARHGLETLAQLIVYDDIRRELQMVAHAEIQDAPAYKWRGFLLDTARNFYSVKAIKRTLDAMAMVKLNTFHWHITDSHSFPLQVKSQPNLYKLGAYSPRKVYSHKEVADVVEYGRARGIRVMPEFDAPAHVGEGWQHTDMVACFNAQPWIKYCVEPPCGQLDPTVEGLYPVLEDIYREMFELFEPDVFHMGGDEVALQCWNSTERIRNWMKNEKNWALEEADFVRLWGHFQTNALARVDKVTDQKPPIILWTSRLTDAPYIDDYLDKERYIIQVWTTGVNPVIKDILKRGYRVIMSNYDALYFDCGGPGWIDGGQNWCSPYIGWQKVYDNNLEKMTGAYNSLVLGAEAAIWSEQIDEFTLDARFWPRGSALAERLWSNPKEGWLSAESRLLIHRQRLVDHGIGAETMQPEWCLQNENECPINAYSNRF